MTSLVLAIVLWSLTPVVLCVALILWQRAFLRRYEAGMVEIISLLKTKQELPSILASTEGYFIDTDNFPKVVKKDQSEVLYVYDGTLKVYEDVLSGD